MSGFLSPLILTGISASPVAPSLDTRATWEIAIDFGRDNAFSGDDVITDYVRSITWTLGFRETFAPIANVGTLSMTLRNTDRRFSPENSNSPHFPNFTHGRPVRVRSTANGVTRTHFLGWIDYIQPEPGQYLERQTQVQVKGFLNRAQTAETFIPVMQDVTADEVVSAIMQGSGIYPPACNGWILGVFSLGGITLNNFSDFLTTETGVANFGVVGDQWGDRTTAYGALRDVAGREGGRIFEDRDGVIHFWNRDHLTLDTVADASFDNSMSQMEYRYGDLFVNRVIVTARPRKMGTTDEVLGQLDKAVKILAGESKEISFRYADQDAGVSVAGKNALAPVANTDYEANSAEDGSGTDYTSSVTAVIVEESATRSKILFSNSAIVDVWIQPGATIRGTKITDYGQIDVERMDADSIVEFGPRYYTYPFEMDDVAEAENMASFILDNRNRARGRIASMMLPGYRDAATLEQCLSRTIGDRITVVEEQTDINGAYFIIGETHQLEMNGDYRVTWLLEPAVFAYWVLEQSGAGELGEMTNLG